MKIHRLDLSIDPLTAEGTAEMEAHVQCMLGGQIRDFRLVVVDQGGLILRGRAHTYYAKQCAQHAVMEATDVPILANEIDVS
jgi:hypothetical protein